MSVPTVSPFNAGLSRILKAFHQSWADLESHLTVSLGPGAQLIWSYHHQGQHPGESADVYDCVNPANLYVQTRDRHCECAGCRGVIYEIGQQLDARTALRQVHNDISACELQPGGSTATRGNRLRVETNLMTRTSIPVVNTMCLIINISSWRQINDFDKFLLYLSFVFASFLSVNVLWAAAANLFSDLVLSFG